MGVLDSLLERLGFVRLRDYGLILTQDRRVVTTRPILEDGFGSTVVGWAGNDLAVMELAKQASHEPPPSIPEPPLPIFAPPPPKPPVLVVVAPPPAQKLVVPAPAPIAPVAAPVAVAPPVEPEEEDWEWEIAAARARATEAFVPARPQPATSPWKDDTAIRSVTQLAKMSEQQRQLEHLVGSQPRTIIPVPQLPVARTAEEVTRQLPMTPRRFPKATARNTIANRNEEVTAVDLVRIAR